MKKTEAKVQHDEKKGEAPRLHRRKAKRGHIKHAKVKRHRMHDGQLVRALERDYSHAKREYHGLGEALREAREAHEARE